jgi:RNA polymerase sigma-70 factor (ECF subfamily)
MDSDEETHLNEKEKQFTLLETAIAMLNPEQKTCIELFYLQKKSYQEISNMTGQSANEVKSNIQNGKRNLKIKMEGLMNERA